MKRRYESVVVSSLQGLVMLLALAFTASKFDRTELLAVGIALPVLAAMEYLRSTAGLSLGTRAVRMIVSAMAAAMLVVSVMVLSATWKVTTLGSVLAEGQGPVVITRYQDAEGRMQAIHVPRERMESLESHRARAADVVAAIQAKFPMKGD